MFAKVRSFGVSGVGGYPVELVWEWENKIHFSVTKLITADLHLYPRFDNSNKNYRSGKDHKGTYLMFKELISLGLTYNF